MAYRAEAGFDVPTIVFTTNELRVIADEAAGFGHDGRHYVSLLKEPPSASDVGRLDHQGPP